MTTAQATLRAWREGGLDRRDPVRFRLIEVLAQRAEGYCGAARKVLDERVATLIAAYVKAYGESHRAELASTVPQEDEAASEHSQAVHADQALSSGQATSDALQAARKPDAQEYGASVQDQTLSALTAYLRGRPRDSQQGDAKPGQAHQDAYPELAALDDFRAIWEHLRTDRQVRESLRQVPDENAGPLNAGNIVHRSLSLMRTVSPEYLRQFMTYLDSLAALERLCQAGDPAGLLVAKLDGNRKGGRKAR